jgi:hydantoinase/carbamoylase family amidase
LASRTYVAIDRSLCATRLSRDLAQLSAPPFTDPAAPITRYAFTDAYLRTIEHLSDQLADSGFEPRLDAIGNLVARNCPTGVPAIGLGSHCDSVRGGGRFDGILGVLAAIEVAHIARERGFEIPLQIVSWVEEEASGFGQMLLGSRVACGALDARTLGDQVRSLDDGRPFCDHARDAGLCPERFAEEPGVLDDLVAWIEPHIEQARVLEDTGQQIGVVEAIAGYVHADLEIRGQTDHAGATPMGLRRDAAVVAAQCTIALEQLALETGRGAVATVGELAVEPGVINAIPGRARLSLDIRSPHADAIDEIYRSITGLAKTFAERRCLTAAVRERQRVAPTPLDDGVADALSQAAAASGARWRRMVSGAAHDTMCVAPHVPSAMVFIPCRGGISHSPAEYASPADAALAVEIVLNAVLALCGE